MLDQWGRTCGFGRNVAMFFKKSGAISANPHRWSGRNRGGFSRWANNEEGRGVESAPFLCNCDGCYWTVTVTVVVEVSCWVR